MKPKALFMPAAVLLMAAGICWAEFQPYSKAIVEGNTAFALELYAQLKNQDGNLFFSPFSISTALALVYAGAKEQTARQMAQTLHFPFDTEPNALELSEPFHPAFGRLITQMNRQGQKGDYLLSIANALWGQKDYPFLDSFIMLNKNFYHAGLETVNFISETEAVRLKINQWIQDKTQDKIKNLIPAGALSAATRLVLTNAIYFKGSWAEEFDPKLTQNEPFYISHDRTVPAPLMHRRGKYRYGEHVSFRTARGIKVETLELPYKGGDLSMVVLLPEKGYAGRFEEDLTAKLLTQWMNSMQMKAVDVYLPRFKIESQFSLSQTLAAMGMPDAFGSTADFSGITGTKDLFISDVLHKAFVEVNEEGTEAAAATAVIAPTAAVPEPPLVFRADRPFVFVIKDNKTGSILFIGRIMNPVQEQ
ncbi:MAG: serpin family protein [Phycisphaerae bacterium]|nr:serpin family protein [Phycisphaerae bacterium]